MLYALEAFCEKQNVKLALAGAWPPAQHQGARLDAGSSRVFYQPGLADLTALQALRHAERRSPPSPLRDWRSKAPGPAVGRFHDPPMP